MSHVNPENTKRIREVHCARIVLAIPFRPAPAWPLLLVFAKLAIPDPTGARVPPVRPGITKLTLEMRCARNVVRENTLAQRLPLQRRHAPAALKILAARVLRVLHLWVVRVTLATPDRMGARAPDVSLESTKLIPERHYAALVPRLQFRPSTAPHLLPVFATLAIPDPTGGHVRNAPSENTKR